MLRSTERLGGTWRQFDAKTRRRRDEISARSETPGPDSSEAGLGDSRCTGFYFWFCGEGFLPDGLTGIKRPPLIMTARLLTSLVIAISAILFSLYQIRLKPLPEVGHVWKDVQDVGRELKETCMFVDEPNGCECKHIFRLFEFELGFAVVILSRRSVRNQTP